MWANKSLKLQNAILLSFVDMSTAFYKSSEISYRLCLLKKIDHFRLHLPPVFPWMARTSDLIGAMEVNLPTPLGNYDRLTNQPTNGQTQSYGSYTSKNEVVAQKCSPPPTLQDVQVTQEDAQKRRELLTITLNQFKLTRWSSIYKNFLSACQPASVSAS